jgi:histidine triad (HIT) family protein
MVQSCIFCQIADRKIPAKIVYEDDHVVAFNDIDGKAPVHVLVCPRKHVATLNDLTEEDATLLGHVFSAAKKVAEQAGVAQTGYRTIFNVNADAGQSVFHLHLHVMGGRRLNWP